MTPHDQTARKLYYYAVYWTIDGQRTDTIAHAYRRWLVFDEMVED